MPWKTAKILKYRPSAFVPKTRSITYEKYKDINLLLPYISSVHHASFESLPHAEQQKILSVSCKLIIF